MSKICLITGKKTRSANRVSHANNKNKRKQYPNLTKKKFFIPSLNQTVTLRVSTKAIRIANRVGIEKLLKEAGIPLKSLVSNLSNLSNLKLSSAATSSKSVDTAAQAVKEEVPAS